MREILIAGRSQVPSDRHRDADTHYLISACHYALILCAGNYSDRDANGAHLYGTQYARKQLSIETNFLQLCNVT